MTFYSGTPGYHPEDHLNGTPRFVCVQTDKVTGVACGNHLSGKLDTCPRPHEYRPVAFSLRVANGEHLSRSTRGTRH